MDYIRSILLRKIGGGLLYIHCMYNVSILKTERADSVYLRARKQEPGFALIATISVMVLLVMIALAMLSLSTIELRHTNQGKHQAEAQANARMALMIALGELQKAAGPDQRVTANAALLDTDVSTEEVEGVEHPRWLGVYKSTITSPSDPQKEHFLINRPYVMSGGGGEMSNDTPLVHDNEENYLLDYRYSDLSNFVANPVPETDSGSGTTSIKLDHFNTWRDTHVDEEDWGGLIGWLVSGDDADPLAPLTEKQNPIKLAEGSYDSEGNLNAPVYARHVKISGGNSGYAYWVSGNAQKASVSLTLPEKYGQNMDELQQMAPQNLPIHLLENLTNLDQMSPEDRKKLITLQTSALAAGDKVDSDLIAALRKHTSNLTVESKGLLVNLHDGGTKRNLTAFTSHDTNPTGTVASQTTDGVTLEGLEELTPLIGAPRFQYYSPKMGIFREYTNKRTDSSGAIDVSPPKEIVDAPLREGHDLHPGPDNNLRSEGGVFPVLMEALVYPSVAYEGKALYELYFPRITLHNPYNVTLKTSAFVVTITEHPIYRWTVFDDLDNNRRYDSSKGDIMLSGTQVLALSVGDTYTQNGPKPSKKVSRVRKAPEISAAYPYITSRSLTFIIEPTEFAPGEALRFFPKNSRSELGMSDPSLNTPDLTHNILSASSSATPENFFYHKKAKTMPSIPHNPMLCIHSGGGITNRRQLQFDLTCNSGHIYRMINLYSVQGGSAASILGGKPFIDAVTNPNLPLLQSLSPTTKETRYQVGWKRYYNLPTLSAAGSGSIDPDQMYLWSMGTRWLKQGADALTIENRCNRTARQGRDFYFPMLTQYNSRAHYHTPQKIGYRHIYAPNHWSASLENNPVPWMLGRLIVGQDPVVWGGDARDLCDPSSGKNRVSPYFWTAETSGDMTYPLFDLPGEETPVISLGMFQHASLNPLLHNSSYPLGSSYISTPYTPRASSAMEFSKSATTGKVGLDRYYRPSINALNEIKQVNGRPADLVKKSQYYFYDMSYEVNHAVWDRFFLTGLDQDRFWKSSLTSSGHWDETTALPNPHLGFDTSNPEASRRENLEDYHHAASGLFQMHAFNVNSTSVGAWATLLKSFRGDDKLNKFGRSLLFKGNQNSAAPGSTLSDKNWNGFRALSDDQVDDLARQIVIEVKRRGPFISLSDFVNRRLVTNDGKYYGDLKNRSAENHEQPETVSLSGTLQAALDSSVINEHLKDLVTSPEQVALPVVGGMIGLGSQKMWAYNPDCRFTQAPGAISQGDILQRLGTVLTARDETFTIRAYGDSRDAHNTVRARAWCEATIQRNINYLDRADQNETPRNDLNSEMNRKFGRRFKIASFRWLNEKEL